MQSATERMNEEFSGQFMQPQAYRGIDIEEAILADGLDYEEDSYYCRLSADGYMDCTEWSGPFDSLEECAEHLLAMYAD